VTIAALIVLAFLVGSIPFGVLVGRIFFNTDIRTSGSGNIGAANALRTYGKRAGVAVLVLDALKGFAPKLGPGERDNSEYPGRKGSARPLPAPSG